MVKDSEFTDTENLNQISPWSQEAKVSVLQICLASALSTDVKSISRRR